jgi:hypothetical protein
VINADLSNLFIGTSLLESNIVTPLVAVTFIGGGNRSSRGTFLETPKSDHDEKVALYLNAILKFDFLIALLVAEHILSSTVALTNYL